MTSAAGISPAAMAASQYYSQFYQNCFNNANNSAVKPTTAPNIIAGVTTPTSLFSPGKNLTQSFYVRKFYAILLLLIV